MDDSNPPKDPLQDRCRVCGGKLSRYKVSYDCQSNMAKLALLGVSTAADIGGVHPQKFCYGCNNICKRRERAIQGGRDYTPRLTIFKWEESREREFGKVGRKPKKPSIGRPSNTIMELVAHMKDVAPQSVPLHFSLRERLSCHPSFDDFKCIQCHMMLDRPLQLTTCNSLVCMTCCVEHTYRHTDLQCPCGGTHTINRNTVISAPAAIQRMLTEMTFPCEKCKQAVQAGKLQKPKKCK